MRPLFSCLQFIHTLPCFADTGERDRKSLMQTPLPTRDSRSMLPDNFGMVGNSPALQHLQMQLRRIGPHFRTVLVTGETGTGKELVARALHTLGAGTDAPFIVCNASAIVESLFESELFGHVRGAFTGATNDRIGLLEAAHNGTLFLDEIGEMPLTTQAKLLRALQQQEVQRVGSTNTRRVRARVIAATNRDLRRHSAAGQFRSDLYYRLAMVEIPVPALRTRLDDIAPLVMHFAAEFARQYKKPMPLPTLELIARLRTHDWPGNIRELENVIGYAVMHCETDRLTLDHLPPLATQQQWNCVDPLPCEDSSPGTAATDIGTAANGVGTATTGVGTATTGVGTATTGVGTAVTAAERLDAVVRRHVNTVLDHCSGNKLRAAETLGISRSTLYRMLEAGTAAL